MLHYLNPLTYLKWIGQFIYAWGMSIPWGNAPKTIPALILVLVLAVTGVIAWSDSSNTWRSNLLKSQLSTALDTDDYETAELLLTRQVKARPNDGDLRYRLAMIQNELGHTDEATAQMHRLVSSKRHKEAARWLVRTKFDKKKWQDLEPGERDEFGALAKLMYDEYPGDPAAKNLYADYLIAAGKLPIALEVLEELSYENPLRGLQAAAVARRLKNEERADAIARRSLDQMSAMSEEDPTNLSVSLAVAQNQLFLKRFTDAIKTLDKAMKLARNEREQELARQAFGDAIVAYVNHIEDTAAGGVADRIRVLEMLQVALTNAPKNPRVLTVISNQILATLNDDNEQLAAIRQALLKGVSPGVAHFIRGTAALMKNDGKTAERELKMANDHMPLSSAVMNNLAVVLIQNEDVDLEQPLKIINEALKLGKNPPPHYYETRGQILKRMERYEEAIPDFERALSVPTLAKKAHQDLAICLENVGDDEMAQLHREAFENFDKDMAEEKARQEKLAAEQEAEKKENAQEPDDRATDDQGSEPKENAKPEDSESGDT